MTVLSDINSISIEDIGYFVATVEEGSEPEIRQDIEESSYEVAGSVETENGIQLRINKEKQ